MDNKADIEITTKGVVAVVAFNATSISSVDEILVADKQIKRFIEENHPSSVVFDFSGVKFFSSQALGLLLNIRGEVMAYGREVVISAIDPQLHRVFRITSLDKVFRFFPDRESAVEAVGTD